MSPLLSAWLSDEKESAQADQNQRTDGGELHGMRPKRSARSHQKLLPSSLMAVDRRKHPFRWQGVYYCAVWCNTIYLVRNMRSHLRLDAPTPSSPLSEACARIARAEGQGVAIAIATGVCGGCV